MKKLAYILFVLLFAINFASCGTVFAVKDSKVKKLKTKDNKITFTIKDKEEVMQREISHRKRSTIVAQP